MTHEAAHFIQGLDVGQTPLKTFVVPLEQQAHVATMPSYHVAVERIVAAVASHGVSHGQKREWVADVHRIQGTYATVLFASRVSALFEHRVSVQACTAPQTSYLCTQL